MSDVDVGDIRCGVCWGVGVRLPILVDDPRDVFVPPKLVRGRCKC